jgi:hypothetical protein
MSSPSQRSWNADLRGQLEKAGSEEVSIYKELKRQRGELNDIHKLLTL